ncbi:unnamed protein product [Pleuronectes platessa]|uniref:Uncharacterized protein n=1 Tax=Pleuronectes platessa TaxID=8262 RepID=A0A9N7VLL1_PLEPL|nr:unnamed protein product [Pleuronectes platessa]
MSQHERGGEEERRRGGEERRRAESEWIVSNCRTDVSRCILRPNPLKAAPHWISSLFRPNRSGLSRDKRSHVAPLFGFLSPRHTHTCTIKTQWFEWAAVHVWGRTLDTRRDIPGTDTFASTHSPPCMRKLDANQDTLGGATRWVHDAKLVRLHRGAATVATSLQPVPSPPQNTTPTLATGPHPTLGLCL